MVSPLDEVLEAFQALLDARRETPVPAQAGRGNFRCENCEDCSHCRFCTDCTACEDCTYCEGCEACVGCTHCKHCDRCKQTTHSAWSSECSESSYLTLCLDCEACVQCFACVGLENQEFCILNEKLPRKAYFSRVAALRGALEERIAAGWRPPWSTAELEDEDEEADEAADEVDEQEPEPAVEHEPAARSVEEAAPAPRRSTPTPAPAPHRPTPAPAPAPTPAPRRAAAPEPRPPSRPESSWTSERTHSTPEPLWSSERSSREYDAPAPTRPSPSRSSEVARHDRNEITVDVPEAEPPSRRAPRATPPWSFADVRRGRADAPEEGDGIPEPPPFGSGPHLAASMPRDREEGSATPRGFDEPTRRRDRAHPLDVPRDRYGWSAQAEGTPVSLGWTAQPNGEPERERWSDRAEDERLGWAVTDPRSSRWGSPDESSSRWSRPEAAPERTRRHGWDRPMGHRPEPHEHEMDRRRRETAAAPSARERPVAGGPPSYDREPQPTPTPRQLDVWSAYDDVQRSQLGPEERTEPDAPVARRGPVRPDLSGAAMTSDHDDEVQAVRRSETRATPRADEDGDMPGLGSRGPSRSLNVARRPERPSAPEPRDRTAALVRGRPPARPAAPAPSRQSDAPSLRSARRPARLRDESPTSEYQAVTGRGEFDPERS